MLAAHCCKLSKDITSDNQEKKKMFNWLRKKTGVNF